MPFKPFFTFGKYAFYKCPAKTINFGVTFNIEINDFSVDQIDAEKGTVTVTGKGNCRETVTLQF